VIIQNSFSFVLFSLFFSSQFAFASIPRGGDKIEILRILSKKNDQKFSDLKHLGPAVYSTLKNIAFDDERTLSTRWQAFMAMVRLGERESLPEINQALRSRDWFLRDAALKVFPLVDQSKAYEAAFGRLDDSALVVRTSAVDTLAKLKNPQCSEKLWDILYSRENYIHNESLWIRRHIIEALADFSPIGSEEKFIKVLADSDSTLFPSAIRGLERLTGKHLGATDEPAVYKRHYWQAWFKEKQKSKS
jgi:hypothetical protein